MKRGILILTILFSVLIITAENVTFNVNMNYQIDLGNFDVETDFLDIAGNFNSWAGSDPLVDTEGNGIYFITIDDLAVDFICEYKCRINGDWNTSEFPGGDNRIYTVLAGENIVDIWYNDQEPSTGDPAPITFIVNDSFEQTNTGFFLKGSWDVMGMYDPTWGNGVEHSPFYDDGSNGDEVAGDHIWSVVVELYPDDGINTWQWGINDIDHNWLEGNFEFLVEDTSPQVLQYFLPTPTEQDVVVTFQVNMEVVDVADSVFVAGTFTDWNAGIPVMTDDDMDFVYVLDVVFPQGSDRFQEYKFVNGSDWEDINNRWFEIDDANTTQILDEVYFNDQAPEDFISQDVTVTFAVNMSNIDPIGVVALAGTFNDWETAELIMTDDDQDNIFEIDFLFIEGTYRYQEYKFLNDGIYEDVYNRNLIIDSSSSIQILDVASFNENTISEDNTLPEACYFAVSNYPNPFNPVTTISFELKFDSKVDLSIYNIKGQLVKVLINKNLETGNHKIIWDGKDFQNNKLPSGLYLYKLQTDSYSQVKKMIMLK